MAVWRPALRIYSLSLSDASVRVVVLYLCPPTPEMENVEPQCWSSPLRLWPLFLPFTSVTQHWPVQTYLFLKTGPARIPLQQEYAEHRLHIPKYSTLKKKGRGEDRNKFVDEEEGVWGATKHESAIWSVAAVSQWSCCSFDSSNWQLCVNIWLCFMRVQLAVTARRFPVWFQFFCSF